MHRKGEIVGVVDFGSRVIRVLVARQDDDGTIRIVGHGTERARGCISQGVIQDLNATQVALKKALAAAEKESQFQLKSVFCAISGKNVDTFIREGNVKLDRQVVELAHMKKALGIAANDILAPGKRVLSSVTSREWYVDDLRVMDPVGIRGQILKTRVHFALVPAVIIDNLVTCVKSQRLTLEDLVFTPLASAQGCLTPEEMELGVAVLDMGRSTADLAVYRDHRILGSNCFEWGGFYLTRDVAARFHIAFEEADELILSYGISDELLKADPNEDMTSRLADRDEPEMPVKLKTNVTGSPAIVDRAEVELIIYQRARELLTKVRQYLEARGLMKHVVCGVVMTGGASVIKNHVQLANAVLRISSRQGTPGNVENSIQAVGAPTYAAAVGLVRHAFAHRAAVRGGQVDAEGPGAPVWRRAWRFVNQFLLPR